MRKKFYAVLAQLVLLMMIFVFSLGTPRGSILNEFVDITGNVVKVETTEGCVTNVFDDESIFKIIKDRIDYSVYYNLVVIKETGSYYLLYYHMGELKDSFEKPYYLEQGDLVCYDLKKVPRYVEV